MTYVSHARSTEELRQEVLTDLNRRIDSLVSQCEVFGRGAAGKARFESKIIVLEEMLRYWTDLQILPKAARKPGII